MTKEEFINTRELKIEVITISDRAFKGEYEDLSGPEIVNLVKEYFIEKSWIFNIRTHIIPDEVKEIANLLLQARKIKADIVFTTGGTGIGPRDFTPEVAKRAIDKEIPGIMENIRIKYGQQVPNALLSRGIAGVMGETQLYCLPGSFKAVKEYMTEILKTLEHLIFMLHGVDVHEKH